MRPFFILLLLSVLLNQCVKSFHIRGLRPAGMSSFVDDRRWLGFGFIAGAWWFTISREPRWPVRKLSPLDKTAYPEDWVRETDVDLPGRGQAKNPLK
jgi:hypothetical protein